MNSEMFEGKTKEINLRLYLRGIAFTSCLSILLEFYNQANHLWVKEADGLSKDSSKRDFCAMAMNQMIQKKLSKKIITEGLYQTVVSDNYKNLLFEDGDAIGSVFSGENSCKVLVKANESIRSFDLFLEEGEDADFHYRITKIRENELYEKES